MMSNMLNRNNDESSQTSNSSEEVLSDSAEASKPDSKTIDFLLPALLSNSAFLNDPKQLLAFLMAQSEGKSDSSSAAMMVLALSNGGLDSSDPNEMNSMAMLFSMLNNEKNSGNSSDTLKAMLPVILKMNGQSNGGTENLWPLLMTDPSLMSENPILMSSLLAQNSNVNPATSNPTNGVLSSPVLMSLMNGKNLDPLSLLMMSNNGANQEQIPPVGFNSLLPNLLQVNAQHNNNAQNSALTNLALQMASANSPTQGISPALQTMLGSPTSSNDNIIMSLLLNPSFQQQQNRNEIPTLGRTQHQSFPHNSNNILMSSNLGSTNVQGSNQLPLAAQHHQQQFGSSQYPQAAHSFSAGFNPLLNNEVGRNS